MTIRRALIIVLTIATVNSASFRESEAADAVFCTNCANVWTQLLERATQIQQAANQAQQLQTQIQQYENMIQNTKSLATQYFSPVMQDVQSVQNLLSQSKAIMSTAKNMDQIFSQNYKTYANYMKTALKGGDWQNKYNQWSQQANDNALYTLKAVGLQSSQLGNDQALMQKLQSMAGSTTGQMEALQVANQMTAQSVAEIQKLRQLVMLQIQMQGNYLAQQQDQQAMMQAQQAQNNVHYQAVYTHHGF